MSVAEIANGLLNFCRQGQFMEAINKYYADNIVSVEPVGSPQMPAEMSGIDAIRGKNQWFAENHEFHGVEIDGPFLSDSQFAARFHLDVTPKASGPRMKMTEMALYTVENGKIVREEFYYNAPGQ